TILNSRTALSDNLAQTYAATNPAHAIILTLTPFDEDLIKTVRNMSEIEEADARRSVTVRLQTGPNEWINTQLAAIPDFDDMKVSIVKPESGAWPPGNHEILLERSALGLLKANVGDTVTLKTPSGKNRQVKIAGLTHDMQGSLYVLGGLGYGHITMDMLEWLGEPRDFNEMHIRVAGNQYDRDHVKTVIDEVQDKIEKSGRTVLYTLTQDPDQPPVDYVIQAILAILGAVGLLSLILSGFLVVNTISAILTQQVAQIGVMKTFGARTSHIVRMYLVMVLAFGLLALLIALPLGAITAFYISQFIAGLLNFDIVDFQIPRSALFLQVAIALIVPLVAGIFPILAGTRLTVQEAINSQGLGKGQFGSSRIDRWLTTRALLRWVTRPTLISLRNTFRRKKRLLLTLATLILGSAVFITFASLQSSLRGTLDNMLAYYQYDVAVQFSRPYRVDKVARALAEVPGVVDTEGLSFYTTRMVRPDGTNSANIIMFAPNPDTKVINPTLLEGRWLQPGDENAVVLDTLALRDDPNIKIGGEVILKIKGKERPWQVVGLAQSANVTPMAFISYETLSGMLGKTGQADYVMVVTEEHDGAYQTEMSHIIEDHLSQAGFRVSLVAPAELDKQNIEGVFYIVSALLVIVAIVLAAVGGLGLMGTMSINVLERTREIGVMRAVGAATRAILKIILFEGIFIGAISWLVGTLIALPLSKLISDMVGQLLFSTPLDYAFSTGGTLLWLIMVMVLGAVASLLPALNAARLTVREVLAYE
ncbi:MAG: ABC transporter permease, partial [Anaerolineae bacterium]|nr:ABC transporter permease [Anaerolineae bacterium]